METLVSKFGDKLFLCGGAARDMLLGIKAKDTDYCVEKVSIEEFESAFPNVKRIDSSHEGKQQPPVYMFPRVGEVALCRKEVSVGNGYNEFEYEVGCSIEEDLARRDFTINAIAISVKNNKFIDPFDGMNDLTSGTIRILHNNSFVEDPLRILRAIRFKLKFAFEYEEKTYASMVDNAWRLKFVNYDRIAVELEKVYKDCPIPSLFFRELDAIGGLNIHFEELVLAQEKLAGRPEHHPEGSIYNHLLESFDRARSNGYSFKVAIAALTHDLGKIDTPDAIYENGYKHIGHEDRNGRLEMFLSRHRFSNDIMSLCRSVHKYHMRVHILTKVKHPIKLIRFVKKVRLHQRDEFISACNCDAALTQEEWTIWNNARKAVEQEIAIPGNIKQSAIPEWVENFMAERYKAIIKGEQ